ncbi:hypothetical protein [Micromonospora sp. RTP1Z1]|uniref:hypothetical protein n=1 Tax=Micromonospora sp. RTP1Z1 TaxID=2994043 RepID=UPI0029C8AC43|nr:hypothetical protein [Micromonospora sp. RTP1Z1]
MAVRVLPITGAEVQAAAEFLHRHLNRRVAVDAWAGAMLVPWKVDGPNHGFLLLADEGVVGVYLAFYSERWIDGRPERFCNLGAWCVLPQYRFHSLRLLKALLSQDGYHFTDLSPSGNVVPLNARLGFSFLDTATALVPNLPWPSWPGRSVISSDPARIQATLTPSELEIYQDHVATGAARHLLLVHGGGHCHVMFRKDRRKDLPVFASILYVSDEELFRRLARPLARHLLIRHGALATLAELRVVGERPAGSIMLGSPRRKMFKSDHLTPDQIDYLYSELACVSW